MLKTESDGPVQAVVEQYLPETLNDPISSAATEHFMKFIDQIFTLSE